MLINQSKKIIYLKGKIILILLIIFFTFSTTLYSVKPKHNPKRINKRGVEFGKKKNYKKAIKEFDKALNFYNKSSAKTYHNMGWIFELQGHHKEAIINYNEAIRRNPKQLPSYVKLGYLYYKTGKYIKAVQIGEYVLKKNPANKEVPKWLPDAYRKKLEKLQAALLAKKEKEKKLKSKEMKTKGKEIKKKEEKKEEKPSRLIYATFDFSIRTAYFLTGGRGYEYISTPGFLVSIPEMIYVNCTPHREWEFDLKMGNPNLGALSPNLVIHTERLQCIYHLEKYSLGLGVLGTHYRSTFNFGEEITLTDFKGGLIFSVKEDKSIMKFLFYPRLLPRDGKGSNGKSLDVSYMEFKYNYEIDKTLSYYSKMSALDYYFFNHSAERSNYWGIYEIEIAITMAKYAKKKTTPHLRFTIGFIERFYMMNLDNDKPYKPANGQGWFGADADKWLEGDPFSGFRAPSHIFFIRAEEQIIDHLFVYQKLTFELADSENRNEIILQLGVGGTY